MPIAINPAGAAPQLERILASPGFSNAPKLQALLRYLVEKTLSGEGERLKGYTIGLDVFERHTSFDPQRDSIVRVQVGRLRKALEDYYAGPGAADALRMELPRGAYAIHFSTAAETENVAQATSAPARHRRPYLVPLIAAASLCVVLLFLGGVTNNGLFGHQNPRAPSIAVAPYTPVGEDALSRQVATGIQVALISDLSRFGEMRIAAVDNRAAAAPSKFDFMLSGAVQGERGNVHVTSHLTRLSDGVVVWTDISSAAQRDVPGLFALQAEIATGVAARLATPHGIVQQQMRADIEAARDVRWSDYECVLSNYAYSAHVSETAHARVRDCLEDVVQNAPRYALAWSMLAWIYGEEERNGFNRRAEPPPFQRALMAAERAVEASPTNEMSHLALASARFDVGDIAGFRESAERALQINDANSEVLAAVGERLAILDASQRSQELIARAIELNPNHPPWYMSGRAIYALAHNRPNEALVAASEYAREGAGLPTLLLAAAYREEGDDEAAEKALADWERANPAQYARREDILRSWRIPSRIRRLALGEEAVAAQ